MSSVSRRQAPGRQRRRLIFIVALAAFGTFTLPDRAVPAVAEGVSVPAPSDVKGLPTSLPMRDALRYRAAFSLISQNKWDRLPSVMRQIEDKILIPSLQAEAWLAGAPRDPKEIASWLTSYADRPQAIALAALPENAESRKIVSAEPGLPSGEEAELTGSRLDDSGADPKLVAAFRRGGSDRDAALAKARAGERPEDMAAAAASLFYGGDSEAALEMATEALQKGKEAPPLAFWIAGLAAYDLDRVDESLPPLNELAKQAEGMAAWDRAAVWFWTGRVLAQMDRREESEEWLRRAAAWPHTFYGLLATRALKSKAELHWDMPPTEPTYLAARAVQEPALARALALIQVGQDSLAEQEMLSLLRRRGSAVAKDVLVLAENRSLPSVSMRASAVLRAHTGQAYDRGLYPVPPWTPPPLAQPATHPLLLALMRQESRFDPTAQSSKGARGLMQLMPQTARLMIDRGDKITKAEDKELERILHDPRANLTLAHDYLVSLTRQPSIGDNLLALLVAYNAGPAKLQRMNIATGAPHDPLLFVERLPWRETRDFVERVLAGQALYQDRQGHAMSALDSMAKGAWPTHGLSLTYARLATQNTRKATVSDGLD
ncbi:MAG: transglycosylase SLT domain-containing protein [Alphaproteobacteria bacterium]|nr:MAG: transglycosylase SLT domain-containing protein [Alphaproteobacteria bacterium]